MTRNNIFGRGRVPYKNSVMQSITETLPSEEDVKNQVNKIQFMSGSGVEQKLPRQTERRTIPDKNMRDDMSSDEELPGSELKRKLLAKLTREKEKERENKHNLTYLLPQLQEALRTTVKNCDIRLKFKHFKVKYQLLIKKNFDAMGSSAKSVNNFCDFMAEIVCKVLSKKMELKENFESKFSKNLFERLI